jgi:transposase-like protein
MDAGVRAMKREAAAREKRARFVAATEKGLSVSAAAAAAGVNRTLLYKWRQRYPDFAGQWDDATTAATEAMEDEALRRALEGVEKPVLYRGKQVGSFWTYNDRLLIRLLERRRPSPNQQEALRAAEAQLGKRLKAVEQREAAVREREEALRQMSPTVSVPTPAPIPSPTVSVAAGPLVLSPAVSVTAKHSILSPTVSVPLRTPLLAIADHLYERQYARNLKPLLVNAA